MPLHRTRPEVWKISLRYEVPQHVFRTRIDLDQSAKIVAHIYHEMKLHVDYCAGFGVTKEQIERTEESEGGFDILGLYSGTNKSTSSMHSLYTVD